MQTETFLHPVTCALWCLARCGRPGSCYVLAAFAFWACSPAGDPESGPPHHRAYARIGFKFLGNGSFRKVWGHRYAIIHQGSILSRFSYSRPSLSPLPSPTFLSLIIVHTYITVGPAGIPWVMPVVQKPKLTESRGYNLNCCSKLVPVSENRPTVWTLFPGYTPC